MTRSLLSILVLSALTGCGTFFELFGLSTTPQNGTAKLVPFASEQELTDYFRDQIRARTDRDRAFDMAFPQEDLVAVSFGGDDAPPATTIIADGGATGNGETAFSNTTTQEIGVDEADVVKTDGTHVYVIRNSGGLSLLTIARIAPPDQPSLQAQVELNGFGREIYIHGDKIVALLGTQGVFFASGGGGFIEGGVADDFSLAQEIPAPEDGLDIDRDEPLDIDVPRGDLETGLGDPRFPEPPGFRRPQTIVTIIDISDPSNPKILSETSFDGIASASRLIDGVLHLVISNFQDFFYDILPVTGDPSSDIDTIQASQLLPRFTRVGPDGTPTDAGTIVTHKELYRPSDPDGVGIVTVVSLDVDNAASFSAVGVVAEPGLIYSSLSALYLTNTNYDFRGDRRETTDIHKFSYVDRGAVPVASGSVPGRVLNQYSMGEHEGFLRVATTVGPTFSNFGQRTPAHNNVYVLGQDDTELRIVGQVEDIAPRETIQSARFLGDRGYVVTFEQIDPFFTLDLSDPTAPRVVGELKIPGFSTFLQPLDDDHLLAVGRYIPEQGFGPWGVQLSIFDVSDFANPKQSANVILGRLTGANSEALFNPKALTYFPERGMVALPITVDRFFFFPFDDGFVVNSDDVPTVDAQISDGEVPPPDLSEPIDGDDFTSMSFDGLVVFHIDVDAGLTEMGRIDARFPGQSTYGSSFTRGVFIGDDVFVVTDHGVRGAKLNALTTAAYEVAFNE